VIVTRQLRITEDVVRVEIGDAFRTAIRVGASTPSGSVRIDDNLVDHLRVEVDGDTLSIDLDGRVRNATLHADIALDRLDRVNASGASQIRIEGVLTEDLEVDASGASSIEIPFAELDELVVGLSGASRATLEGSASTIDADVSGASRLSSFDLTTEEASVEVSGASTAELTVEDELEATVSGASSVRYEGDPDHVISDVSGASSVAST
jgi:putative autotransporter adhesin-like protein